MTARCTAAIVAACAGASLALGVTYSHADPPANGASATVWRTVTEHARYHGHGGEYWANQNTHARRAARSLRRTIRAQARTVRRLRREEQSRWAPTVSYAISLASRVFGVSESKMRAVAYCESTFNPFASNGRYHGLFQLGWSPFGMSPFDPIANALSAARTVAHDGSWRQWSCG